MRQHVDNIFDNCALSMDVYVRGGIVSLDLPAECKSTTMKPPLKVKLSKSLIFFKSLLAVLAYTFLGTFRTSEAEQVYIHPRYNDQMSLFT